jgi:hypothetical protein
MGQDGGERKDGETSSQSMKGARACERLSSVNPNISKD